MHPTDESLEQTAITSLEARSPIVRTVHTRVRLRQPLSVQFARQSVDSIHYITLTAENNWNSTSIDLPEVPLQLPMTPYQCLLTELFIRPKMMKVVYTCKTYGFREMQPSYYQQRRKQIPKSICTPQRRTLNPW